MKYVDLVMPLGVDTRDEAIKWAKTHCSSYTDVRTVVKNNYYHYRFYFCNNQDRVMFALRWAQ